MTQHSFSVIWDHCIELYCRIRALLLNGKIIQRIVCLKFYISKIYSIIEIYFLYYNSMCRMSENVAKDLW